MKRYLLLPGFFFALALLGACMMSPVAPSETPAAQLPAASTFTTTAPLTTTTVVTAAVNTAEALTPTMAITPVATVTANVTANVPVTVAVTATPILTPTAAVTAPPGAATQNNTIAGIVAARPEFSTLNQALTVVQLVEELNGDAPYTLLAPTDAAFAALPAGAVETLLASPSLLVSVLQNHLLIEEVPSARLVRLGRVLTAFGQTLPVTLTAAGTVQLGSATLVEADIDAANGVVHALDTVLLPANVVIPPAVTGTVTTTAASAQVSATQAVTTVQIITTIAPTATIADIVRETDELARLETALGAAGLLQALELPGQLTIFAPTNAAFEALPPAQLQALLNNTNELAAVMQYHLVADTALSTDLVRLGTALSTSSQPMTVTVAANGAVLVNNAQVVQADIVATNGVIHLIDRLLTPPAE